MKQASLVLAASTLLLAAGSAQDEKREQIVWMRDLASARAIAEKEWRLTVLFFYGEAGDTDARKHHKHIDGLFKDETLKTMAKDYVGVRVSCHTHSDEAKRYGASKGPLVVILAPDGREIGKSVNTDAGTLVQVLGRFAGDFAPQPVAWRGALAHAVYEARTLRGLVLVCGHEKDCKTCRQAQDMLMTRRLVFPRKRLSCVRLEKKEHEAELKELGIGALPHLTLVRPGRKPDDPFTVVHSKLWPAGAKALAQIVEEQLKKIDDEKQ